MTSQSSANAALICTVCAALDVDWRELGSGDAGTRFAAGCDVSAAPLLPPPDTHETASLVAIAHELVAIENTIRTLEEEMAPALERVVPTRSESAKNLVHYVALRQHDLRDLQCRLLQHGLSSLGRSESCVMASLLQVSERVHESLALRGDALAKRTLARIERQRVTAMSWESARSRLHDHTREALGPRPDDRHIYIMVTAPDAEEGDRAWMAKMLAAGMNLLRINCAHEGEQQWARMVTALDEARKQTGKACRVLMDLAGPKIRTGPIAAARRVATWRAEKDEVGRVTVPAKIAIRARSAAAFDGLCLRVTDEAFDRLREGDELRFHDARGKKRRLVIREAQTKEIVAWASKRAYVADHVSARVFRDGAQVGDVILEVDDTKDAAIGIQTGDALVISKNAMLGKTPRRDREGRIVEPGVVGCLVPAALDHLEVGHRVLFDDGRIHAVVEGVAHAGDEFFLRVVRTQKQTVKLRAEKGINLPDTPTSISALTDEDRSALAFVAEHADAVGLSFVRSPEDVRALHEALDGFHRPDIGIVLKIETRKGFENLPRLLLEGLQRPPLAVMIARGDLAVEVGFERLAELQEEILWLCEASHVPVIWATQVLDTLARTGVPSRAEVTDAAASVAAECVMLNKGPFIGEAVSTLSDILHRMEQHHDKKRSLFRKLEVSTFNAR